MQYQVLVRLCVVLHGLVGLVEDHHRENFFMSVTRNHYNHKRSISRIWSLQQVQLRSPASSVVEIHTFSISCAFVSVYGLPFNRLYWVRGTILEIGQFRKQLTGSCEGTEGMPCRQEPRSLVRVLKYQRSLVGFVDKFQKHRRVAFVLCGTDAI